MNIGRTALGRCGASIATSCALGLAGALAAALVADTANAATCGPRTTESNDQIVYAIDCTTGSSTGGIQEAIDSCGSGYTTQGCIVVLPRGPVVTSTTITVGGLTTVTAKEGVTLRGHGSGSVTNVDVSDGGTTLIWDGDGGTVLSIQGRGHRLEDLTIWGDDENDGSNVADVLVELRAKNSTGTPTSGIIIENVDMKGTTESVTKPIGILVDGLAENDQLDRIMVRNSSISNVSKCLEQDSNQALLNIWQMVNCAHYTDYGVNILAGSFSIIESVFSVNQGSGATAAIRFHSKAGLADPLYQNIERSHFEIGSGSAIVATSADGKKQRRAMRIVGNNFVMQYPDPSPGDDTSDNDVINLSERGSVALIGNSFEWTGPGSWGPYGADIVIDSSLESQVFAAANYTRNLDPLDWEITGQASLVCNDADSLGMFDDVNCNGTREPGEAYANGASNSNNQGAVRWGISDGASWDSGSELCAETGLSCVTTVSMHSSNSENTCSHTYGSGDPYIAFCK